MAPLLLALRDAAATEPDAQQVWQDIGDRRAGNMRRLVAELGDNALRAELSTDDAADTIWATASSEMYIMLTRPRMDRRPLPALAHRHVDQPAAPTAFLSCRSARDVRHRGSIRSTRIGCVRIATRGRDCAWQSRSPTQSRRGSEELMWPRRPWRR